MIRSKKNLERIAARLEELAAELPKACDPSAPGDCEGAAIDAKILRGVAGGLRAADNDTTDEPAPDRGAQAPDAPPPPDRPPPSADDPDDAKKRRKAD